MATKMKASISLKQLRQDPREYVRLLNSGYEVEITEHRKPIAKSTQSKDTAKSKRGNGEAILKAINELPPIRVLDPALDTVSAVKKAKTEYLEQKYRRILKQHGRS